MSKKASGPKAEQLRAELVQLDRDIRGTRDALQAMRARRAGLRARLSEARARERRDEADAAPDENRDTGGEG
jgi:uncharacterized coiled-coil DUF342 family protein